MPPGKSDGKYDEYELDYQNNNIQTKKESFIESCIQVVIGFIVSLIVWVYIVVPFYDLPVTMMNNLQITGIFTITSVLRQYIIRRLHC